jgi:hypothetical protein
MERGERKQKISLSQVVLVYCSGADQLRAAFRLSSERRCSHSFQNLSSLSSVWYLKIKIFYYFASSRDLWPNGKIILVDWMCFTTGCWRSNGQEGWGRLRSFVFFWLSKGGGKDWRDVQYARLMEMIFPPRRPGFEPRSGHVGFVVDKVTLGQVFSKYSSFPWQLSFHRLLHNHHHMIFYTYSLCVIFVYM